MKGKTGWRVIVVSCLACSLAACSSGGTKDGDSANGPSSSAASGKKVQLKWWYADSKQQDVIEKIAQKFNDDHPNIKVTAEMNAGSQYYTKLQTVLAANSGPDIMWMDGPDFPKFQSKGFLLAYNDLIKKDNFSMDNYPKSLVDLYSIDGKMYGMPKDFDTIGLYYNKELFDKENVKYPDASWTWNDLLAAAKKLTLQEGGKTVQWGFAAMSNTQESIYPFMVQNGAKLVSADKKTTDIGSDNAVGAVQFLYDLMYKEKVSPDGKYMIDNKPGPLFKSGKVAMITGGSWNARSYYDALKEKLDVAVLPKQKQEGNIIHGIGWTINAKTKNPNEAWEFVKWLGSKDVAMMQANAGAVIPAFNGTQDTWVKSLPYNLKVFIDMTKSSTPYPISNNVEWEDPVGAHISNIWLDKEKAADGMKAAQNEANKIMAGN
ncbi:ABC transporter substrate-binding protein [Paenibacillus hemerocallicola]|uniref:ABC transporter substrate-binding protein n=1 Tax=Paenibacillus hemerocallicola TaxID=1172614 RepID=UPI00159EEE69|nr:sugar ABC transporter substrate-binding protein [Paenibacillus hemerocallicola]